MAKVKIDHNVFSHFNLDEILELAKQRKCPVCQRRCIRLHLIRHENNKYYVYCDHGNELHYIAPFGEYTYVINNIKGMYYLYMSGMFSKEQFAKIIFEVFEMVVTESKEDEKFRKIMIHSLKQLLEILQQSDER